MDRLGRLTRVSLAALIAATSSRRSCCLKVVRDLVPYEAAVSIPWWALAAGFAVAEAFVIHAHVRGSAHSLSLSEVPLVLGLLLAKPSDLIVATVVGPLIVLLFTRGHGFTRLAFNLAQFALTATLATITLHALAPAPAPIGPEVWARDVRGGVRELPHRLVLVFCAIGLSEGGIPSRRLAG